MKTSAPGAARRPLPGQAEQAHLHGARHPGGLAEVEQEEAEASEQASEASGLGARPLPGSCPAARSRTTKAARSTRPLPARGGKTELSSAVSQPTGSLARWASRTGENRQGPALPLPPESTARRVARTKVASRHGLSGQPAPWAPGAPQSGAVGRTAKAAVASAFRRRSRSTVASPSTRATTGAPCRPAQGGGCAAAISSGRSSRSRLSCSSLVFGFAVTRPEFHDADHPLQCIRGRRCWVSR